jgi:hypothetical protein
MRRNLAKVVIAIIIVIGIVLSCLSIVDLSIAKPHDYCESGLDQCTATPLNSTWCAKLQSKNLQCVEFTLTSVFCQDAHSNASSVKSLIGMFVYGGIIALCNYRRIGILPVPLLEQRV